MLTSLKCRHRICSGCISFFDEWEIFPCHVDPKRNIEYVTDTLKCKTIALKMIYRGYKRKAPSHGKQFKKWAMLIIILTYLIMILLTFLSVSTLLSVHESLWIITSNDNENYE